MNISITESYVDSLVPNASSIKNPRDLTNQEKLVILHKTTGNTLIFGECTGSVTSNYHCSSDFIDPTHPQQLPQPPKNGRGHQ